MSLTSVTQWSPSPVQLVLGITLTSASRLPVSLCIDLVPLQGFPGGSAVKNLPASAGDTGDLGSIPGF